MNTVATSLPAALAGLSDGDSREPGWRREDLPLVARLAAADGFACLGGQVQFRLPDGTCELYWRSFDPEDRASSEPWFDFVHRSWSEALQQLDALPSDDDLIIEAKRDFEFLKAKASSDLRPRLWFVAYPVSEIEWHALRSAKT